LPTRWCRAASTGPWSLPGAPIRPCRSGRSRLSWPEPAPARASSLSPQPARARMHGGRRMSFRQGIEIEHGVQQRARLAKAAEPSVEDRIDVAAAIELDERTIHREAEVRIIAPYDQCVRLVRKIAVEQLQPRTIDARVAKRDKRDSIACVGVDLS